MNDIIQRFNDLRLSLRKDEVWRGVDFSDMLDDEMTIPSQEQKPRSEYQCNIPNLDAMRLTLVNGICMKDDLQVDYDGVTYGSLRAAMRQCPDLVEEYMQKCMLGKNPYEQFNAESEADGVFIYIPDGLSYTPEFQIMSMADCGKPVFFQTRNLIVVGIRSSLKLIHCDDSYNMCRSMSNTVTGIYCGLESRVEHYKLQNMNDLSGLLNHNYVACDEGAEFRSFAISLNGGHIRNHNEVRMLGERCHTEVDGLYLIDKEQKLDNYVFVEHAKPNCESHELFKGIMDDSAHATFNGHVLVGEGAVKTEASQSNKNILLTDKATIQSKPFLEIYNDDVKCSHGSTTGQIDEQALFYIRSRGISERTARTMLLYAFCDEVIRKIGLTQLRDRLSDMVKKRLHGELTPCADCALHCSTPCNGPEVDFKIDVEKL